MKTSIEALAEAISSTGNITGAGERDMQIDHFDQMWSNTLRMFNRPGEIAGQGFTRAYSTVISHEGRAYVHCDGRLAYSCASACDRLNEDRRDRMLADIDDAQGRYSGCKAA